jgi:Ser/Thr protein kinase RdoA (MazF antagonist)
LPTAADPDILIPMSTQVSGDAWFRQKSRTIANAFLTRHFAIAPRLTLVRFGENAIFRERGTEIVLRVYRSPERADVAKKCVLFARHLQRNGFPAVRPRDDEVFLEETYPITVWSWVAARRQPPCTWLDFGSHLEELHAVASSYENPLSMLDPLSRIRQKIENIARSGKYTSQEIQILESAYQDCTEHDARHAFSRRRDVIHGDAHRGNTICSRHRILFLDFDNVCYGPREWDLVPTMIAHRRFGLSQEHAAAFEAGYGARLRDWKPLADAVAIQELSMITWLCQNRGFSKQIDDEIALRLRSCASGDTHTVWHAL